MAKVKVYELAKELNINSKDIISFLSEKKIEVKSHMSNLEEDSIALIRGKYEKKGDESYHKTRIRNKAPKGKSGSCTCRKAEEKIKHYGSI